MLSAALHLATLASLWGAWQGTVGVAASSRGGARSGFGEMGQSNVGYDVDFGGGLGLSLGEGRFSASIGYSPYLTLRDLSGRDPSMLVLHSGYLTLGYGGRGWSLSLIQGLSIGTTTFRGLRATPVNPMVMPSPTAPRVELLPTADSIDIFNESTRGSFTYQWDPRLSSSMGASYSIGGGRGARAQAIFPRMTTASGDVGTRYAITARDTLGAELVLSRISARGATMQTDPAVPPTPGSDFLYWTLTGGLSWSHRFSTATSAGLGVGAYGYSTTMPGRTTLYTLAFTGGGSIDTELYRAQGLVMSTGVGASVGPMINPFNGTMQQRVQGTGRFSVSMSRVSFSVSGDGIQSFPTDDPGAIRLVGAGANLSYAPGRLVDLSAEYRSTWQTAGTTSIPRLWVLFVGVGVRAPPIRF